jgi:hypothetical protein
MGLNFLALLQGYRGVKKIKKKYNLPKNSLLQLRQKGQSIVYWIRVKLKIYLG